MPNKRSLPAGVAMTLLSTFLWSGSAAALTDIELLGKNVFFDKISKPEDRQACASCHDPAKGWTLPDSNINKTTVVAPGARPKRLGSIKPPSNAYATFSPPFRPFPNPFIPPWEGGNFWDGRAEGYGALDRDTPFGNGNVSDTISVDDLPPAKQAAYQRYLGPTADQALNPFPNKVEQNIRIRRVCRTVRDASYGYLYQRAFGEPIVCRDPDYARSYKLIAVALAAWQASSDVNSFSSKRDIALRADADKKFPLDGFNNQENLGHDLFYNVTSPLNPTGKTANCVLCHNNFDAVSDGTEPTQVYSDSRYHNIGTPFNREIPTVVKGEKTGLTAHVTNIGTGHFRTPTLRNVGKGASAGFTKAYAHNGWFKGLKSIVHFYNTRDALPRCETLGITNATEKQALQSACWPAPEFPDTAAPGIIGNLGLSNGDENAIVAYLNALTDQARVTTP